MTTQETQTGEGEKQCGICYTDLNCKNTVITSCDHAFCSSCFFKWLGRKETCAMCRSVLISRTAVDERESELEGIQQELTHYYGQVRRMSRRIRRKRALLQTLTDDITSITARQIRMRQLLDQTRETCKKTLKHNRDLKRAMELQQENLDTLVACRTEWNSLLSLEEDSSQEEMKEMDIETMHHHLEEIVELERRRALRQIDHSDEEHMNDSEPDPYESATETVQQEPPEVEDFEGGNETMNEDETDGENNEYGEITDDEGGNDEQPIQPRRFVRVPPRTAPESMFVFGESTNEVAFDVSLDVPTPTNPIVISYRPTIARLPEGTGIMETKRPE
jgi:hypothetical protein